MLEIVTRAAAEGGDAWLRAEQGFADSSGLRGRASVRRGVVGLVVAGSVEDQDSTRLASGFTPTRLEDGGRRLNSDRSGGSALASLTFDAAPGTCLGLNLNLRSVERGKPPVTEDAALSDFAPVARFERAERDALSLHAAVSHEVGPRLTLRPTLYLNRAEERTRGFDEDTFSTQRAAGALRQDATTSVFGAGLQVALQRGRRGLATVALDLRQEAWKANGFTMVGAGGGGGGGGRCPSRSLRNRRTPCPHTECAEAAPPASPSSRPWSTFRRSRSEVAMRTPGLLVLCLAVPCPAAGTPQLVSPLAAGEPAVIEAAPPASRRTTPTDSLV
ncbi:MAG TPA: hypothetical protein VNA04_06245 [Thermoanaerobaculia bacterium]|nr:hypothetical protein [Thermoanaerobaculia bacterium]